MKRVCKIVLILLSLFATERFCYWQTRGFRVAKICRELPEGQLPPLSPSLRASLQRPLSFLGRGVQCYVFETEDGQFVLKLFKHFHAGLPTKELARFADLPILSHWIEGIIASREQRTNAIYQSCELAAASHREETALLYVHLKRTSDLQMRAVLLDRIGIAREIDLDSTPFILQRKALLLDTYLQSQSDHVAKRRAIHALVDLIASRCRKGIVNTDPAFERNFGFLGDRPIEIDVGSFTRDPNLDREEEVRKAVLRETQRLRGWLRVHHSTLEEAVDEAYAWTMGIGL